jgi:hypothetical protein
MCSTTGSSASRSPPTEPSTTTCYLEPWAALHVTREDFFAYVVLEGHVELAPVAARPDDPTVDELVWHYRAVMGEHEDWDAYRKAMVTERHSVVRFKPEPGVRPVGSPTPQRLLTRVTALRSRTLEATPHINAPNVDGREVREDAERHVRVLSAHPMRDRSKDIAGRESPRPAHIMSPSSRHCRDRSRSGATGESTGWVTERVGNTRSTDPCRREHCHGLAICAVRRRLEPLISGRSKTERSVVGTRRALGSSRVTCRVPIDDGIAPCSQPDGAGSARLRTKSN